MANNPNQFAPAPGGGAGPQFDGAAEMLRQTRPWVRLVSIMMFVGAAFMVLAGGFMMLGGAAAGMGTELGPMAGAPVAIMGVIYIAMALLYIVPATYLWQYAGRSQEFDLQRSASALTSALQAQKSFWKFCGICIVIYLVLIVAALGFGIIAMISGAAMMQ